MSGQEGLKCISVDAGADLSALQFTAVRLGSDRTVVSAANATAPITGILQNKPTSGQAASVAIGGIAKALVGAGGWSSGDLLTATTGGALITTTTDGHFTIGEAMEDAAAGEYAQLLIKPGQRAS